MSVGQLHRRVHPIEKYTLCNSDVFREGLGLRAGLKPPLKSFSKNKNFHLY